MKLTPHQILQKLGFDAPAEGVEINGDDAYLHTKVLSLAGQSISLAAVPDEEFHALPGGEGGTERSVKIARNMAEACLATVFRKKAHTDLDKSTESKLHNDPRPSPSSILAPILAALSDSKFHFTTKRGYTIPLLLVWDVQLIGESESAVFDLKSYTGDTNGYYAAQPKGSLAVSIVGWKKGWHILDQAVVESTEVPAFTDALRGLR
jgi:hypothetical protein